MKMVYVRWHDASTSHDTNIEADDIKTKTILESVGFLVKETKYYLCIAMDHHVGAGKKYNTPASIPKGNIIERREVSAGTFKKRYKNKIKNAPMPSA